MNRRGSVFVAAILAVCALGLAAPAAEPEKTTGKATEDYNMAAWLYGTQKFDLAAEEFRAFLQKYPNHEKVADARLGLARSLRHLGKNEEAIAALEELRKAAPNYERMPEALFYLGEALAAVGKPKEAADAFDEILKKHDKHYLASWARARRGEVFLALKQPDEAEKTLAALVEEFLTGKDADKHLKAERKRLQEIAPAVAASFDSLLERALLNLGLARLAAGRFDAARETFEEFLALASKSDLAPTARFHLAQSLYQTGQYDRAADVYAEVAKSKSPLAPDAAFEGALALYQAKKYKQAAAAFADCAKRFPDSERASKATLYAGMCLYLADDYAGAIQKLQEKLQKDPSDTEALYWLGTAYLKQKGFAEARGAFEKILKTSPDGPRAADASVGCADALLAEGKPEEASKAYRAFAEKHPDHADAPRALYAAAAALHRAGKYEESDKACDAFLAKAAANALAPHVLFISGENRFLEKKYKEAAERYQALLEKHGDSPDVPAARFRLAWVRYFQKDYDAALKELAGIDAKKADAALAAEAIFLQGNCFFEKGNYKKAAETFGKYLDSAGGKAHAENALLRMGLALARAGDSGAAVARLNQFVSQYAASDQKPQAQYELAELLRADKKWDEAANHYKELAEKSPDHALAPYALYHLGTCRFERGAFAEAADVFGRAADKYAASDLAPQAMYQKALSLQKADRVADARAAYQAMLAKFAGHDLAPSALLGLGTCLEKEKNYAEAADAFRKLLDASKDDKVREQAAYELAWSLQQAGKEKEALEAYERLARDFAASALAADANFQIAEARYRDKKYADADALYSKALAASGDRLKDKILYRLGWCKWAEAKYDEAAKLFDRLVAETPQSDLVPDALLQAGEALARLGKPADAIERLSKLADPKFKDFPHAADARFRLGEAQAVLGRHEDALATLSVIEQAYPGYAAMAEVQFGIGKALYDLKRLDQARQRFERVLGMTETETGAKAQFYVGETYLAAGNPREALKAYLRVVSPLWIAYTEWAAAAQFEIGKCYLSLEKPKEAREALQTVVDKYKDTKWAQPARDALAKLPA